MKKIFFISAIAALGFASCANDDVLDTDAARDMNNSDAIAFQMKTPVASRATSVGEDAAKKLNYNFVVYGTKHSSAENGKADNDAVVFDQYDVAYEANTAGTTESNTCNWEYVGKTAYKTGASANAQTIRYWDYSATEGYTFYAFSSKDISYPAKDADLVSVTKTTADPATTGQTVYKKGYSVTIKNGASMDDLYYSDRKPVAKNEYGDVVTLTFRNLGSRVRVGFYETIPGYKVQIEKFYFDDNADAAVTTFKAMDQTSTTAFKAALQNVNTAATSNTVTVTYNDATDASVENRVTTTNSTATYNYDLTLGTGLIQTGTNYLATTSAEPTWDSTNGAYTTVYPFEANNNPMLVRLDYKLISEDGSETIEIKNARCIVPVQYVQWKPNTAYTYLFKLTADTNGTTGNMPKDPDNPGDDHTDDPEGLHPITFDAVVIATDDYTQETITTVATNSVTTYANGSKVTTNGEYMTGEDIYVVNEQIVGTHQILAPTGIGAEAGKAQIYTVTAAATSDVIDEATVQAKLTGANNGLTLAAFSGATLEQYAPASDGTKYDFGANGAVKFTPTAAGSYAYVYCTTAYVAPTYAAATAAYVSATTYYFKTEAGVYYAASGIDANNYANYQSQLYTQTAPGTAGVYDVKVITVK